MGKGMALLDVHNTCLAVAVMSVLLSCAVIWSSLTARDDQLDRHTKEIQQMLTQLQVSQEVSSSDTGNISREALDFISSSFPWLSQPNSLGNYYTGGHFLGSGKYSHRYTKTDLSLLTHFQDFGGHFADCLLGVASDHHQAVSPEMTLENRHLWDSSRTGVYRYKHKFRLHYGAAAQSLCDDRGLAGGQACGQVLIMQDPIRMAMGKYGSCQIGPMYDTECQSARTPEVSIEDWIIHRGNRVFKNLIYNSAICKQNLTSGGIDERPPFRIRKETCDRNLDIFLASLSPENTTALLGHVVSSLESWFAMVGLYEHLADTLAMLYHVTRLPLHQCPQVSHLTSARNRVVVTDTLEPRQTSRYVKLTSLRSLLDSGQSDVSLLKALSQAENDVPAHLLQLQDVDEPAAGHAEVVQSLPDVDVVSFSSADESQQGQMPFDFGDDVIIGADTLVPSKDGQFIDLRPNDTEVDDESDDLDLDDDDDAEDRMRDVIDKHQLTFETKRHLEINKQRESLYNKLSRNEDVLRALSLDIQIYKAVRRLYHIQSRLFFNSIHL
ncbi:hypothetical protein Btru_029682 [Bulinus truncatus]|nr:hypothetical protein Btru_029682 [Bulinus truncatus]